MLRRRILSCSHLALFERRRWNLVLNEARLQTQLTPLLVARVTAQPLMTAKANDLHNTPWAHDCVADVDHRK